MGYHKGYHLDDQELLECHTFMNPKHVYSEKKRILKMVHCLGLANYGRLCFVCKIKKILQGKSFNIHDALYRICPICWIWFNSISRAQTRWEHNHNNILTNRKAIKENQDIIEQTVNKTKAIDDTNKEYTTQLREVQCFTSKISTITCRQ